jgi:tetratricopeptide (TPR) repeat protein
MGLLKQLFRQNPEKYEQRGDELFNNALWGMAKIEYEKALDALEKEPNGHKEAEERLQEKLHTSKEALAQEHKQNGEALIETEHYNEARELLELAMDLSRDKTLVSDIRKLLQAVNRLTAEAVQIDTPDPGLSLQVNEEMPIPEKDDEAFLALCGTLPDNVRKAYLSYGESFKSGYLALNRGEFGLAADELSLALNENPTPDSFVPLELATAFLNLGNLDEARRLLESFLQYQPDALPGYQVLCEVLWEMKDFDHAEALLEGCPDELKDSVAYFLLRGESMFQAEKYSETITFYQGFLKNYGWNDSVTKALAKTFETLGELEEARKLYVDILNQCSSCHTPIDPFVKRKFADLSFDLGQHSQSILEAYLSLAQEDSENRQFYYGRISRIYAALGNEEEARRFQAFAELAQMEKE